ncbi:MULTISPECIES: RICIN domain-containing protein [Streptomyces]|uniref:RICIN domain-containing protein n=1 Tax=Streptomyces TaxID=1883 RepID=UPI00067C4671|nr:MULTISPECIES: RICIN domain-containing protein [Streptomyces]KWT60848.1 hypothetical protein ADL21_16970 [Streptomyces albus subsp. albus]
MSVSAKGTYLIKNVNSGLYLTVKGHAKQSPADIVQDRLQDWPQRAAQAWRLESAPGGERTFRIQNQHSGGYLQVRRWSKDKGAHLVQEHLEENTPAYRSQSWQLTDEDPYRIANVHSGLWVNVQDHSAATGAVVEQSTESTGVYRTAEQWTFEPVEPRGGDPVFDALSGLLVEPGGGIVSTVTHVFKASLEAAGGVFGTFAKYVPGDTTPFVRFEGFRGDEVIRFSSRNRVEAGPRKISTQFPHLPKEFHGGFDFVTRAPRHRDHTYLGVKGDLTIAFSDKGNGGIDRTEEYFPSRELEPYGRVLEAAPARPDDSQYLLFCEQATVLIDGRFRAPDLREVQPMPLGQLPKGWEKPDAVASATVGDEVHFFAVKGTEYTVFTLRDLVQGPAPVLNAYPFLLGLWA